MKKSLIFAGMLAVGYANAQYEGKVGVNTETPKATLEVKPSTANLTGTTNEGLLIPRLSKERVAKMASPETSTLVYVNEATTYTTGTDTAADARVAKIDAVGFYHYNGTQWVKHLDTDTNDAEWVYDAATNRINLKRSGTGTMANSVFYDANTGQYVDVDDENTMRKVRFNVAGGILSSEEITETLSTDLKYKSLIHSESKNLNSSIIRAANGTETIYKQIAQYDIVATETDTTQRLNTTGSKIIIPLANANNFIALYGDNSGLVLAGTGSVATSIAQTGQVTLGNTQKVSDFTTGILGSANVNTSGTINNIYGVFGRNYFYSPAGATVVRSAAGFFETSTPLTDNSLVRQNIGVLSGVKSNSQNTGTGTYMAGVYNYINQQGKTKYPNVYGIYSATAVSSTAVAPTNLYGLYIADVKGGETLNRAIHTEAGKIRFGDLADATATADRVVTVDKYGVLKTGEAVTNTVKLATTTSVTCDATTTGTMNFGTVTINSNQTEAFGFCMKNSAGEYKWYYIYGGAGITTGSGTFGTGL